MRRRARSIRSFERKTAFRTNPPGVMGRPRRHYPPRDERGMPWKPKLIVTIKAKFNDPADGKGEFAIVRTEHPATFDALLDPARADAPLVPLFGVWQNDQKLSTMPTLAKAKETARRFAHGYDMDQRDTAQARALLARKIELLALTSEQRFRSGRRMRGAIGALWRSFDHVLCLSLTSRLVERREALSLEKRAFRLRDDIRRWCLDQGIRIRVLTMPFAWARVFGVKAEVFTVVVVFRTMPEAMFFKVRWW